MDDKRRTTTKDIALLLQLYKDKQLNLAPEFQRASVWPRPAKAYLIDTILTDRPIPLLFFSRALNAQTGRSEYEIIDGQQRLRAVFEFVENKFALTESSEKSPWHGKRYADLDEKSRRNLLNYDFVVEELSGYSITDIEDMFRRMNRYVVPLNPQEQRHAITHGEFKHFVEEVGAWSFWINHRIFSANAADRRRTDEFAAELAVLLMEGPQDKKKNLDLYFTAYASEFPLKDDLRDRLIRYTEFINYILPNLREMQLRRPANFYALIGAIDVVTNQGEVLRPLALNSDRLGELLRNFDSEITSETPQGEAARYVRAASRQTDNIAPRQIRIATIASILRRAKA